MILIAVASASASAVVEVYLMHASVEVSTALAVTEAEAEASENCWRRSAVASVAAIRLRGINVRIVVLVAEAGWWN